MPQAAQQFFYDDMFTVFALGASGPLVWVGCREHVWLQAKKNHDVGVKINLILTFGA